jgi:cob(I)alamin adenosyltransferase
MKKIYTRTGDDGTTALFGGNRVTKTHPRIEAYGTVDETNAHIGVVQSLLRDASGMARVSRILERIQDELFIVGADLATEDESQTTVPRIESSHIDRLEEDIDMLNDDLPPLEHFVLPGGSRAAATLHLARTTCRRAERLTVAAAEQEPLTAETIRYLNRLSDLFFVAARWVNHSAEVEETQWTGQPADRD